MITAMPSSADITSLRAEVGVSERSCMPCETAKSLTKRNRLRLRSSESRGMNLRSSDRTGLFRHSVSRRSIARPRKFSFMPRKYCSSMSQKTELPSPRGYLFFISDGMKKVRSIYSPDARSSRNRFDIRILRMGDTLLLSS